MMLKNRLVGGFWMGWQKYSDPEIDLEFEGWLDDSKYKVGKIVTQHPKFKFIYDFGDWWSHSVMFEKWVDAELTQRYPVCLDGKYSAPPEARLPVIFMHKKIPIYQALILIGSQSRVRIDFHAGFLMPFSSRRLWRFARKLLVFDFLVSVGFSKYPRSIKVPLPRILFDYQG